jgi:hypothetical protein
MRRVDVGRFAMLALLGGFGCGHDAAPKPEHHEQPAPAQDGGDSSSTDPGSSSGSAELCTPGSRSRPFADDDPCPQSDPKCLSPMWEARATCGADGDWAKNADGSIVCACDPRFPGTGGTTVGAGGTGGVTAPLVAPTFHATIDDGDVVLQTSGQAWYWTMCADSIRILKRAGDAWVPLRNDLPQPHLGHTDDYYLDGKYIAPSDINCDVFSCQALAAVLSVGHALQYVKTGTKARPHDAADAGLPADEIPFIETREYQDEIAVSVDHSEVPNCGTDPGETTIVPVLTQANDTDAGK